MIFTLEPLQAAEGDCLLLHWSGDDGMEKLAVIDGGPGRIYEDILRKRLVEIANGALPLSIELVMVSHMDSDHIVGVKKLVNEVLNDYKAAKPEDQRFAKLERLWFNVFNDVLGDSIDKYYKKITASVKATVGGEVNPELEKKVEQAFIDRRQLQKDEAEFNAHAVAGVLAGYADGRTLRSAYADLRRRNAIASLNSPFRKNNKPTLLTSERTPQAESINGVMIQIVGPRESEIEALQKEFDEYIEEKGLTAESVLAAYADESAKNLSSIVCIASVNVDGKDKTILLTGDARGDYILAGLEEAGLMVAGGRMHFDVLKVPHHGSNRNVEPEFFQRLTADHYVLSGNGKHGNPDRDTLQWVFDSRDKVDPYDVYLTYPISSTDLERRKHHEKKDENGPWNQATHSLKALIDTYVASGHSFTIHEEAPFKIDLGDEPASR